MATGTPATGEDRIGNYRIVRVLQMGQNSVIMEVVQEGSGRRFALKELLEAFLRHRRAWHRPRLLGIAFEAQRMEGFAAAPHDVPLWGVVTERAVHGKAAGR